MGFDPDVAGPLTATLKFPSHTTEATEIVLTGTGKTRQEATPSVPSISFGSINVGSHRDISLSLSNTGTALLTLTSAPLIEASANSGFSLLSTTCGASVPVGEACTATVRFAPLAMGETTGVLTINTDATGSPQRIALSGVGVQAIGELTALTSSAFGDVPAGSSASRTFVFKNTGNKAIADLSAAFATPTSELTRTNNTCGTASVPVTLLAGVSCSMTFKFAPSYAQSIGGATLSVNGTFAGNPASMGMTGTAEGFNVSGAWSSSGTQVAALTAADLNFGDAIVGDAASVKTLYLVNTGTNGKLAAAYALSGDTAHFKIYEIRAGSVPTYTCGTPTGVIAADGLSTTPCIAYAPVVSGATSYPVGATLRLGVKYAPLVKGNHKITVTPLSSGGVTLPGPVELTGNGVFDAAVAWSSSGSSVVDPTAAKLAFAPLALGEFSTKVVYLSSTGTVGAFSAGVTLTGDVSQFTVTKVYSAYSGTSYYCAGGGGVIAPDGHSFTPCAGTSSTPASGSSKVSVTVTYNPTTKGNHSITLTPSTDNGTRLPAPLVMTGTAVFDAMAVWSSASATTTTPTASFLNYGAKALGTATNKQLFLHNTGTKGAIQAGFTLVGDTSQFTVSFVTVNGASCLSGGAIAADKLSSTPCMSNLQASPVVLAESSIRLGV